MTIFLSCQTETRHLVEIIRRKITIKSETVCLSKSNCLSKSTGLQHAPVWSLHPSTCASASGRHQCQCKDWLTNCRACQCENRNWSTLELPSAASQLSTESSSSNRPTPPCRRHHQPPSHMNRKQQSRSGGPPYRKVRGDHD